MRSAAVWVEGGVRCEVGECGGGRGEGWGWRGRGAW